ncbi:hypothetical protein H6P81_009004 [Aristolochia fimbriata]|uniref:S-adenosylmethionine-dependent methyltransferase n=1 Tax=Aristolochia fimbriata TaxID=158543 RepID=A0AAV7EK06_ARIFI|nr:hypothetical protein H6P81_009004 [Aristolochia fimbriata]
MEALPMIGGEGPNSYAKNSSYQKEGASTVLGAVKEAILKDSDLGRLSSGHPFRIADLGCSVGPNTFDAVDAIIEAMKLKLGNNNDDDAPPEFHVFFNDLPSNDFNTLLRSPRLMEGCGYFAAAVPGSCHGRLFPKSSLHFVQSFYTLHWLSRVPEAVEDENSPAWNKGHIFAENARAEVMEAFSAQFVADMERFLRAREDELVPGALMALVFPYGRRDHNTIRAESVMINSLFGLLELTLQDMVAMGKVDQHKVDAFNFPLHLPSPETVEKAVERNGSFDVEEMKVFVNSRRPGVAFDAGVQSKQIRAVTEKMITKQFGEEILDEIFERHRVKVEEVAQVSMEKDGIKSLFVLLKRKPN